MENAKGIKLSVFFDHILEGAKQTREPLETLLKEVRDMQIEAVEMHLGYLLEQKEIPELLRRFGLKVSSIYESYELEQGLDVEKARKHIEAAVQVGAEKILVVPGFLHGEEARQMKEHMGNREALAGFFEGNAKIQSMAEGLSFLAKEGKERGITVTVEDFDNPESPLSGVYGVEWFLRKVPLLQYTMDTGNYLYYGEDILEVLELLKDKIVHVHCKDRLRRGQDPFPGGCPSVAVGTGYIPMEAIVSRLKDLGYQGYLSIEHFGVENQRDCIRESAAFLGGILYGKGI